MASRCTAAVHGEVGAGDEACRIGRQEQRRPGGPSMTFAAVADS